MNMGTFPPSRFCHSKKPSAGIRQRRRLNAERNAGFSKAVSERALIILLPVIGSLAHDGTSPHLNKVRSCGLSLVITAMGCEGEILKRGACGAGTAFRSNAS